MNVRSFPSQLREPVNIRCIRLLLNHWPFRRGKGLLMRILQPFLGRRPFLMYVDPGFLIPASLDDYMERWTFMHGYYSEPAIRFSHKLLRPGDVVLDVGANIGLWTLGAALRVGPAGRVYSFEPVPENLSRLTANLELNGITQVAPVDLALSDRPGAASFFASTNGNSGMGALVQRQGVDRPISVTLETLDNWVAQHGLKEIHFIKVDVEGAESRVFRGAAKTLSKANSPAILFECSRRMSNAFGSSSTELKSLLASYGYSIYRCQSGCLTEVPVTGEEEHEDLFALKSYHTHRLSAQ